MRVLNDARDGRDDEEDVTEERDSDSDTDGLETTPPSVGDVGTEERNDIDPESVEGTDTGGGTLTEAKSTGLVNASTSS